MRGEIKCFPDVYGQLTWITRFWIMALLPDDLARSFGATTSRWGDESSWRCIRRVHDHCSTQEKLLRRWCLPATRESKESVCVSCPKRKEKDNDSLGRGEGDGEQKPPL